jgi:hypothetical protein
MNIHRPIVGMTAVWICVAVLMGAWSPALAVEFSAIFRANPDGTGTEELLPSNVAEGRYDFEVGNLYMLWTADAVPDPLLGGLVRIRRANPDGTNVQNVYGPSTLRGIAFDEPYVKVFGTLVSDTIPGGWIFRVNLDGSDAELLYPGGYAGAIAVDPVTQRLCWADVDLQPPHDYVIRCVDLDSGSDPVPILFAEVHGLTIDSFGQKIYFTGEGMVRRANLDGTDVEVLVTGQQTPWGIAVDPLGGRMWWADRDTGKIQRADLDGSNVQDVVLGLDDPTGIGFRRDAGGVEKIYWLSKAPPDVPATTASGLLVLMTVVLAVSGWMVARR